MAPAKDYVQTDNFLVSAWKAWDRFWFKPADPTTLGLMRLIFGFSMLYVYALYSFDLQALVGPNAWFDLALAQEFRKEAPTGGPAQTWDPQAPATLLTEEMQAYRVRWGAPEEQIQSKGQYKWSIWYHVTSPAGIWIVHIGFLVVLLLFAIGFCTRVTSVLAWLGLLSYIHRAPTALFGMDTMSNLIMLYLVIAPSGAALSVDRLIRRWWLTRRARQAGRPAPVFGPPPPMVSATFATRLLQINVCAIYLVSGLSKLQGQSWLSGVAVWYTMANYEFSPMRVPVYMESLRLLCSSWLAWQIVVTGLTYGTLALEISYAFLIWNPRLRWVMLAMVTLMHIGIAVCMGLVMFSVMMMIFNLAMVPPAVSKLFLNRLMGRADRLQFAASEGNGTHAAHGSRAGEAVRASARI
jgi:Vitamin K-dependent gamma-carboxylase